MALAQCTSSCSMQLVLLRLPSEILDAGVGKLPGHGLALGAPTSRNSPNPSPWPLLGCRGGGSGAVCVNCIM
uniref:Uncharacterized protein n=1 Tax=Arundo donax TaxID=35708 RepID=A0A0A9CX44_ARUDO